MADKKCTGKHTQHICSLAESNKIKAIKKLTKNVNFLCSNCGRAAEKEENLCSPVDVAEIGLDAM